MEAYDEENKNAYSHPPLRHQPGPWLVICDEKHQERQTFFSTLENHYYPRIIPDMCSKYIETCNFGWLVLKDCVSDDFFLLNLRSMKKAHLPELKSSFGYMICILSATPSDPNCRVIFHDRRDNCASFCRPGDVEYIKQELDDDYMPFAATTFKGKVYWLTLRCDRYSLVVVDFTGQSLHFRGLIKQQCLVILPEVICSRYYLIESENELLVVHKICLGLSCDVMNFRVLRVEFSKMEWVEVESIGQRTIFLDSNRGMASSSVEAGTRSNCIYFVDFGDKNLYVFDMEDRSITTLLPCPNVSRHDSLPFWIWL
ncbi:hypothetical protein U1Q18_014016 [Sarracenia purpurea var. burkii]